jgi:hypothetical protein
MLKPFLLTAVVAILLALPTHSYRCKVRGDPTNLQTPIAMKTDDLVTDDETIQIEREHVEEEGDGAEEEDSGFSMAQAYQAKHIAKAGAEANGQTRSQGAPWKKGEPLTFTSVCKYCDECNGEDYVVADTAIAYATIGLPIPQGQRWPKVCHRYQYSIEALLGSASAFEAIGAYAQQCLQECIEHCMEQCTLNQRLAVTSRGTKLIDEPGWQPAVKRIRDL